jgi:hypothetical protein
MVRHRSYWTYSIGSFVVWGILLRVAGARGSDETSKNNLLLVFGGWTICWVSQSIARVVYPPPKRWLRTNTTTNTTATS